MPSRTKVSKIEHGKRTTYVRGCRCELCCAANTEYGQELKRRRLRGDRIQPPLASIQPALASVTTIGAPAPPAADPDEPGRVETAVSKEIKSLSAARKHPGLIQSILSMAKILDNPEAVTTHPSAHRQLAMGLEKLWGESVGRKGTLADVAAMTNRTKPAASGKRSG
jgi:hypothetical protein